jgi:hypothetical protein
MYIQLYQYSLRLPRRGGRAARARPLVEGASFTTDRGRSYARNRGRPLRALRTQPAALHAADRLRGYDRRRINRKRNAADESRAPSLS